MTEAEKAAAAKATAEAEAKKKADEAAKKEAEEGADDEGEDEAPDESKKGITREEFEAFKRKANKEAEKHRVRAKAAEEALETFRSGINGALGIKPGENKGNVDDAAKASTVKQRSLLLRAEFIGLAAAAGAVSASDAFELARPYLKDVAVDLDAETVDGEALAEAVKAVKTAKPFLFKSEGAQNEDTGNGAKSKPGKMPDGSGRPSGGGTAFEQWQALEKSGRRAEAAAYYGKNKAAIKASWK